VIEIDEAQQQLEPIQGLLVEAHVAVAEKWATFLKENPDFAHPFDDTARANVIHPHIRYEVERRIESVPGFEVNDKLRFFAVMIGSDMLLRFKYVGHGMPHNFPTTRQKELASQRFTKQMTADLLGDSSLQPPTLVTCGHTFDGEKLGRLEIRRDCKGHLPWSFDIFGGEAVNAPVVIPTLEDEIRPARVKSAQEQEETAEKGQRLVEEA
jgi:hypothetical protein